MIDNSMVCLGKFKVYTLIHLSFIPFLHSFPFYLNFTNEKNQERDSPSSHRQDEARIKCLQLQAFVLQVLHGYSHLEIFIRLIVLFISLRFQLLFANTLICLIPLFNVNQVFLYSIKMLNTDICHTCITFDAKMTTTSILKFKIKNLKLRKQGDFPSKLQ